MASFRNGDVEIAYLDEGPEIPNAEPIVLVHGFASTKEVNWVNTSWVTTLMRAGLPYERERPPSYFAMKIYGDFDIEPHVEEILRVPLDAHVENVALMIGDDLAELGQRAA